MRSEYFERQSRLAWTRAQVEMTHLNLGPEDAHLFQKLAERVIYAVMPRCALVPSAGLEQPGPNPASGPMAVER